MVLRNSAWALVVLGAPLLAGACGSSSSTSGNGTGDDGGSGSTTGTNTGSGTTTGSTTGSTTGGITGGPGTGTTTTGTSSGPGTTTGTSSSGTSATTGTTGTSSGGPGTGTSSGSTAGVEVYETGPGPAANAAMPEHLADKGPLTVGGAPAAGTTTVTIDPTMKRQTITGFGAALTEAVASVMGQMTPAQQQQVLSDFYGPNGSGYTIARTHIGSCDFALTQYSFDDLCYGPSATIAQRGACHMTDPNLTSFSIKHDTTVDPTVPGSGLLVPLLKSAIAASGGALQILGSPWSAPGWMKTNFMMQGMGSDGSLATGNYAVYAKYISMYISAYKAAGVPIWAITPQNEAAGVGGSREGMQFTPQQMNTWIGQNLGPTLKADGNGNVKIFIFDHNNGPANSDFWTWAGLILKDPVASQYVAGSAVHWYGTTWETWTGTLDQVHADDPTKGILFNEGTADELGTSTTMFGVCTAPCMFPWMNDSLYYLKKEYDWGWYFGGAAPHHIPYEIFYRYSRDIIDGLNHWYIGWMDWNALLNKSGGPSHIGNPVPATIMVDTTVSPPTLYYSPTFYIMRAFAKFMRPGATVLSTTVNVAAGVSNLDYDGTPTADGRSLMATSAVNTDGSTVIQVFNETGKPIPYSIVKGTQSVSTTIAAQSLQTVVWK
jgi:glucosylceramidase